MSRQERHDSVGGGPVSREEVYVILKGSATFPADGQEWTVSMGTFLLVRP